MQQYRTVATLALIIVLLAEFAAIMGIFSFGGPGKRELPTFRGNSIVIHGTGVYRDMPAEVAPQGIAQDYLTLFAAIPLLLVALILAQKNSVKARLFLAGVLLYFVLTYLFWLTMGMYNDLFLVYVSLASLSLFSFLIVMLNLSPGEVKRNFRFNFPRVEASVFLMISAGLVGLMWLKVVVPPLFLGRYPEELLNFTTLIVQGLDLAYFLPFAIVSAVLLWRKSAWGYLFAPVYLVFLSLIMAALLAKMVYMKLQGFDVPYPVMGLIGAMLLGAIGFSVAVYKGMDD